jgi:hypothetical protein
MLPDGPLRNWSPRLPRIIGALSEANRSAPVVPVSRNVMSSFPWATGAVRTTVIASRAACSACAA